MFTFKLRRIADMAICTVEVDHTYIDMGCLNISEAKNLLEGFKQAVDDLEWFIQVMERKHD